MANTSTVLPMDGADGTNIREPRVKIDHQIILTKDQYELLRIISRASNMSISKYIQKAVIEMMKTEIEFGDFCDMLLEKLENHQETNDIIT